MALRELISTLTEELTLIKADIGNLTKFHHVQSSAPANPPHQPGDPAKRRMNSPSPSTNQPISIPTNQDTTRNDSENCKLNIVVHGIPDCKQGLHYKQRFISDLNNITSRLNNSDPKVPSSSIKDCRRLGKYTSNNRPRPILVHFNSCTAVMHILANRSAFTPYVVKPDLPPQERTRERTLLKERWTLCQAGMDKSSIKIKGNSLFVNGHLYGKVNNESVFHTTQDETGTTTTQQQVTSTTPHESIDNCASTPDSVSIPKGLDWLDHTNNVEIRLWNSRSIVNKLKHFQTFIQLSNLHLPNLGVLHTLMVTRLFPPDYTIYRTDRIGRGGHCCPQIHSLPPYLKSLLLRNCCHRDPSPTPNHFVKYLYPS